MNCLTARNHLLTSERPAQPMASVAVHLEHCPGCRHFQRRLVRVETAVAALPVPASTVKKQFVAQLIRPETAPRHTPAGMRRESGRQKVALAFALAASLLIFAIGWWAWPHQMRESPSPYQVRRDQRLARAETPRQRVIALADLADEILEEAKKSDDAGELRRMVFFFTRLVQDDLPGEICEIPVKEREQTLNQVLARFRRAESETARLAAGRNHPHAAALSEMATALREADRRLCRLFPRA